MLHSDGRVILHVSRRLSRLRKNTITSFPRGLGYVDSVDNDVEMWFSPAISPNDCDASTSTLLKLLLLLLQLLLF